MTEKRFTKQEIYDGVNRYQINESNFIIEILDDGIPMHYSTIVNRLNKQHKTIIKLEKENEQLKQELHKIKLVNEMLSMDFANSEHELWKENEQLKEQLNYIQNSINNAIKHQKTELQVKTLKEIIQDYNEWLLGHKGDVE